MDWLLQVLEAVLSKASARLVALAQIVYRLAS